MALVLSIGVASSSTYLSIEIPTDDVAMEDIPAHVKKKAAYMLKINPAAADLARAFPIVSIRGALAGSVDLVVGKQPKVQKRTIKGFLPLSKAFKG